MMTCHEDDEPGYKYDNDRRNDPELKAKVAKVLVARQNALKEADALLKQAAQILSAQSDFVDGAIYNRQVQAVRIASFTLSRDTEFEVGGPRRQNPAENDNYLGNLAAGPLGEQIEGMGDDFPL
jgi:hypothetical protein